MTDDTTFERQREAERLEEAVDEAGQLARKLGLEPYPGPTRSSPTVTAFSVPGRATALQDRLRTDHDVTLATGFGDLKDDILRVGHMGYNADIDRVERAMEALDAVL